MSQCQWWLTEGEQPREFQPAFDDGDAGGPNAERAQAPSRSIDYEARVKDSLKRRATLRRKDMDDEVDTFTTPRKVLDVMLPPPSALPTSSSWPVLTRTLENLLRRLLVSSADFPKSTEDFFKVVPGWRTNARSTIEVGRNSMLDLHQLYRRVPVKVTLERDLHAMSRMGSRRKPSLDELVENAVQCAMKKRTIDMCLGPSPKILLALPNLHDSIPGLGRAPANVGEVCSIFEQFDRQRGATSSGGLAEALSQSMGLELNDAPNADGEVRLRYVIGYESEAANRPAANQSAAAHGSEMLSRFFAHKMVAGQRVLENDTWFRPKDGDCFHQPTSAFAFAPPDVYFKPGHAYIAASRTRDVPEVAIVIVTEIEQYGSQGKPTRIISGQFVLDLEQFQLVGLPPETYGLSKPYRFPPAKFAPINELLGGADPSAEPIGGCESLTLFGATSDEQAVHGITFFSALRVAPPVPVPKHTGTAKMRLEMLQQELERFPSPWMRESVVRLNNAVSEEVEQEERVAKAQAAAAKWQAIEEAEVQLAWDMCDCARAEEEAKKPDAEPNTAASTTAADDDGDELAEALEAEFEALDG